MKQWFEQAFSKLTSISLPSAVMLGTLILIGIGLIVVSGKKVKWSAKMLSYASLSIAMSFILSLIRLYKMPQGGSVTAAGMLPLILFSYAFGAGPGVLAGAVYGLLDFLQGGQFLTPWSFLLDYPLAYALIGSAGVFRNMKNENLGLTLAVVTASLMRFLASLFSGVMFYAAYAEGTGMSPFLYSLWYNGSYMLPEMVICLIVGLLVGRRTIGILKRG